jgi:hypothetical protein
VGVFSGNEGWAARYTGRGCPVVLGDLLVHSRFRPRLEVGKRLRVGGMCVVRTGTSHTVEGCIF